MDKKAIVFGYVCIIKSYIYVFSLLQTEQWHESINLWQINKISCHQGGLQRRPVLQQTPLSLGGRALVVARVVTENDRVLVRSQIAWKRRGVDRPLVIHRHPRLTVIQRTRSILPRERAESGVNEEVMELAQNLIQVIPRPYLLRFFFSYKCHSVASFYCNLSQLSSILHDEA